MLQSEFEILRARVRAETDYPVDWASMLDERIDKASIPIHNLEVASRIRILWVGRWYFPGRHHWLSILPWTKSITLPHWFEWAFSNCVQQTVGWFGAPLTVVGVFSERLWNANQPLSPVLFNHYTANHQCSWRNRGTSFSAAVDPNTVMKWLQEGSYILKR